MLTSFARQVPAAKRNERLARCTLSAAAEVTTAEALVSELQVQISNRLLKEAIWRAQT
jgi:hypothetical protein